MWNSIVGHSTQLKRLEHDILNNSVHHAYLFVGPGEIGKSKVAKAFASYLHTGSLESSDVSRQIAAGSHAETLYYPASDGPLKIETVREIIQSMQKSFTGDHHVCIIEDIERMTVSASNCLLKILEEPPQGSVFILTTEKVNRILPTILSRVRMQRFFDIPRETLLQYLEGLSEPVVTKKQIERLLELSDGKMGRVFHFLHNEEYFQEYSDLYDETLQCLRSDDIVTRFHFVEKLLKDDENNDRLKILFHILMHIIRVMMQGKIGKPGEMSHIEAYNALEKCRQLAFHTNTNKRLLLEHLMLNL